MAVAHLPDADKYQLDLGCGAATPSSMSPASTASSCGSVKPQAKEAKAFQDWVTHVALPAIRKDGAYVTGEEKVTAGNLSEDELVMRAMSIISRKVERLTLERDRLPTDNQLLPSHM